jgi:hypothetical protein
MLRNESAVWLYRNISTWASMTAVDKFADHLGIKGFAVER